MRQAVLVVAMLVAGCGSIDPEIGTLFSQCEIPEGMQTMTCTDQAVAECEAMGYGSSCVMIDLRSSDGYLSFISLCCGEPMPAGP